MPLGTCAWTGSMDGFVDGVLRALEAGSGLVGLSTVLRIVTAAGSVSISLEEVSESEDKVCLRRWEGRSPGVDFGRSGGLSSSGLSRCDKSRCSATDNEPEWRRRAGTVVMVRVKIINYLFFAINSVNFGRPYPTPNCSLSSLHHVRSLYPSLCCTGC